MDAPCTCTQHHLRKYQDSVTFSLFGIRATVTEVTACREQAAPVGSEVTLHTPLFSQPETNLSSLLDFPTTSSTQLLESFALRMCEGFKAHCDHGHFILSEF